VLRAWLATVANAYAIVSIGFIFKAVV